MKNSGYKHGGVRFFGGNGWNTLQKKNMRKKRAVIYDHDYMVPGVLKEYLSTRQAPDDTG